MISRDGGWRWVRAAAQLLHDRCPCRQSSYWTYPAGESPRTQWTCSSPPTTTLSRWLAVHNEMHPLSCAHSTFHVQYTVARYMLQGHGTKGIVRASTAVELDGANAGMASVGQSP
ncbi:hypothetical protein H310_05133 [Aphanomyces invadans]|uniref:Uncharacterized protein n=1 Tax=Aphanomyces invadans TaxID=157072 RepID=A0A024UD06_9STRA|nr:hypothetical protein H310_05133 [Aphanomyces invadans]ETW03767.1 hypothetical protein H310_05133 [Aphanomyces invadans]|eukprot:XP_008867996.1 hypothetical protein H310_05133 [Aphanomyces invadans]